MAGNVSATDVAEWMLQRFHELSGYLYQEQVVYEIQQRFGDAFTRSNRGGNPAIAREGAQ